MHLNLGKGKVITAGIRHGDGTIQLRVNNDGATGTVQLLPQAAHTLANYLKSAAVVIKEGNHS